MGYQYLLSLAVLLQYSITLNAMLFDNPSDCSVTTWSAWSAPYGFGQIARRREVLRYPRNGGAACPDLDEVQFTAARPTTRQTAQVVSQQFCQQNTTNDHGETVGQLRDLLVIVDSSGSIGASNFTKAKNQLAKLLGLLCPDPDPFKGFQQAALIQFSSTVREIFDFNDKKNTRQVQAGIKSMAYMGGSTCSATAFNYANNNMFTTAKGMRTRPDVKQEILILSDGKSNCGGDAVAAARALHPKAEVFALVIGTPSNAGKQELTDYVSPPSWNHLFSVLNFVELEKLVNYVKAQVNLKCVPFEIY